VNVVKTDRIMDRHKVILGLYMDFMERWEGLAWFSQFDFLGHSLGHSYYSEEDLTSDIIGFYLMTNNLKDPRKDDRSWIWLSKKCDFLEDRQRAYDWSLDVINAYPGGTVEGWKKWFTPRLLCSDPIDSECKNTNQRVWPTEFMEIKPEVMQYG
jgi:hypothetical protein